MISNENYSQLRGNFNSSQRLGNSLSKLNVGGFNEQSFGARDNQMIEMRPGRNSHLINAQNYPSQQVARNTYTPEQALTQKQGDDIGENK